MRVTDPDAEWLQSDMQGGFASGTASGIRRRRYHALLLTAAAPPSGRVVLMNGVEAWVQSDAGRYPLSTHIYVPDVVYPDGYRHITDFAHEPWPTWTYLLPDGTRLCHDIIVDRAACETLLRWRLLEGPSRCTLSVTPLLSGRDYHALHRENGAFRFDPLVEDGKVSWHPYADLPATAVLTNGTYHHSPDWFRQFVYTVERARGLDYVEDLAAPGHFSFDLAPDRPALAIIRAGDGLAVSVEAHAAELMDAERQRSGAPLLRMAAAQYLVERQPGKTIIAGFPWFGDWGRDTFVAMRGLVIGQGLQADAERILLAWSDHVSEGMLPNRFPDGNAAPEYNAVDASLWFVIAVHELLAAPVSAETRDRLSRAVRAILAGYAAGTRFGIKVDDDGLLQAGAAGTQLTWMDAVVDGVPVTPRVGKPVEVQALWINALAVAASRGWGNAWADLEGKARTAFRDRFPAPAGGLYDVVDVDHLAGHVDARLRPNQILAVGGLPFRVIEGPLARSVVDTVEQALLTPLGLRSLAPDAAGYISHYRGDPRARDSAYHQGTVWPWLIGAFVEAWLVTRDAGTANMDDARQRFLAPLTVHLETAGLGHVSEVADGDAPHAPGGCPFQAWSLGEYLRLRTMLNTNDDRTVHG